MHAAGAAGVASAGVVGAAKSTVVKPRGRQGQRMQGAAWEHGIRCGLCPTWTCLIGQNGRRGASIMRYWIVPS